MNFNDSKFKAMVITRKRIVGNIGIYLNNKRLEIIPEVKYLGLWFDHKLSFDKHVETIAEKSKMLIHMLWKSAKLQWGLGHKSLRTIYEAAEFRLMIYGAPEREHVIKQQKNLSKLQCPENVSCWGTTYRDRTRGEDTTVQNQTQPGKTS